MNREIIKQEIKIEEEKIDWHKEWENLKKNKIFLLFIAIIRFVYLMFRKKGARDEKDKKNFKGT